MGHKLQISLTNISNVSTPVIVYIVCHIRQCPHTHILFLVACVRADVHTGGVVVWQVALTIAVVWQCGGVVVWWCVGVVCMRVWRCCDEVVWWCGGVVAWWCSGVVAW